MFYGKELFFKWLGILKNYIFVIKFVRLINSMFRFMVLLNLIVKLSGCREITFLIVLLNII